MPVCVCWALGELASACTCTPGPVGKGATAPRAGLPAKITQHSKKPLWALLSPRAPVLDTGGMSEKVRCDSAGGVGTLPLSLSRSHA